MTEEELKAIERLDEIIFYSKENDYLIDIDDFTSLKKIKSLIERLQKELETYTKIAYKLAGCLEETKIMQKTAPIYKNWKLDSPRTVVAATSQDIIDWARKDVEKR